MAGLKQFVGDNTAQDTSSKTAQRWKCSHNSNLHDGHMSRLTEVDGKPGQEEPCQSCNAVLSDVNADQHSVAQQHSDRTPLKLWRFLYCARTWIDVCQPPALFDEVDLGLINARVSFYAEKHPLP